MSITEDYMQSVLQTESKIYTGGLSSRLMHGLIGIATESGELLDAAKKALFYGIPLNDDNVIEELGDLMWYVFLVLDSKKITLNEVLLKNMAKLSARYPTGFSAKQAAVRDLVAEGSAFHRQLDVQQRFHSNVSDEVG